MSEEEKQEVATRVPKTDEELKQLARDLYSGKVYTDRHIPEGERPEMVFMGLVLGGPEFIQRLKDEKIWMMYQYMSEACPMAVNGQPSFLTFHTLNQEECERLDVYYKKILDAMEDL